MRRLGRKITAITVALGTATAWLAGTGGVRAADSATSCSLPVGAIAPRSASPAALGFDPAKLQDAIDFETGRSSLSVQVYRDGCLAGASRLDALTKQVPNNIWSSTKGVVSMLVGRAVTLGKLSVDDPIGAYLPAGLGDSAHRAITVRQLLTQSSGLKFSFVPDVNPLAADTVRQMLALPFAHTPGTYFEYAENAITLLGYVVQQAVGQDLQEFAQAQLFEPIGIARDHWFWLRDRAGVTLGYAWLFLPPKDFARLGLLMQANGSWNGRQLISPSYIHEATQSSPTNPGYGFLYWVNAGDSFITPSTPSRRTLNRPLVASAPRDMYAFIGLLDQVIFVVPSLHLVVVRTGLPGNQSLDPQAMTTTTPSADNYYEFFRRLMAALNNHSAAAGPYRPDPPNTTLDVAKFVDPTMLVGSTGFGPGATPGCTLASCKGTAVSPSVQISNAVVDLLRAGVGLLTQR